MRGPADGHDADGTKEQRKGKGRMSSDPFPPSTGNPCSAVCENLESGEEVLEI